MVRDAEGRAAGVVAAMADVSQAGRGERLLEQTLDALPFGVWGTGCARQRDGRQLIEPGGLGREAKTWGRC